MLKPAIEIAKTSIGATAPNPPVGAAGYDLAGNLIGVGLHRKAGLAHAEIDLIQNLQKSGKLNQLHTLAVTLEPCCHTDKKTPPCVNALLQIPTLKQVLVGCLDPNPQVQGRGIEALRAAGKEVLEAKQAEAHSCLRLITPFSKWIRTGLPWVVHKQAFRETLGGMSMIPEPGAKTFTSRDALRLAHQIRRESDAILTTSKTVLADQPEFTVRQVQDHHDPKPRHLVILQNRTLLPTNYLEQAEKRGFICHLVQGPNPRQALESALTLLGKLGCLQVLIEAGPTLSQQIQNNGLWDESVVINRLQNGSESIQHVYRDH